MRELKVIVFDCDGVMFDTRKANTAYYNTILKRFGKPPLSPEQFDYVHMHTAYASICYLFDNETEQSAALSYSEGMRYDEFIKYMEIEPDLKPLLKWLTPEIKTAVATNRSTTIGRVLSEHQIHDCFDLVVSALDVPNPKPAPDMLLKILEYFDVPPDQTLYIGDSQLDEDAAMASGIPLVAYKNKNLSAKYYINRLVEIREIVDPHMDDTSGRKE